MWLAKGACASCAAPVARRAAWPLRARARCNVCHRSTQLLAWRARGPTRAHVALGILLTWAVLALFAAGAARPDPTSAEEVGAAGAWASLEQRLVLTREGDRVIFHLETRALDAEGYLISPDRIDPAPEWRFAEADALADPMSLAWGACAAPPVCPFTSAADAVVHFTPADPIFGAASAYDARDGSVWLYVGGAWTRWADPNDGLTLRFVT